MTEREKELTGQTRVMTRAESRNYDGLTIEGNTAAENAYAREQAGDYVRHDRPYAFHVHTGGFGWPSESRNAWLRRGSWQNWLVKAALAAGVLGLAVFFIGIILPVLFVVAGLAIAGGLLWRFLR